VGGVAGLTDLAFEEFAFDRLLDEEGRWERTSRTRAAAT
jgi:hypothetical protein